MVIYIKQGRPVCDIDSEMQEIYVMVSKQMVSNEPKHVVRLKK